MLEEACHEKNTVVFIYRYSQCLNLMYSEVAWILLSGTQVQLQRMLDLDYLPGYPSILMIMIIETYMIKCS